MRSIAGWRRSRSLLSRFVLAAGLAVAIGIGVVVLVAYFAVRHQLVGQVDGQLRRQARDITHAQNSGLLPLRLRRSASHFGVTGNYVQIIGPAGVLQHPTDQQATLPVAASDRAVAQSGAGTEIRNGTLDGAPVRLLTTPLPGERAVQVALPLSTVDSQLHRLAFIFGGVGLGGLAVAGGLAFLFGRRTLTPVARLTAAAEQVAATRDLAHRIVEDRGDELGRLAISFNTMLGALQKSQSAQRQLVADASHELRTPLASLRTNVEVLNRVAELDPADRTAVLRSILTQLDELASLVGDVVELARGDEPAPEFVDIRFDLLVSHAVERAERHWPALTFVGGQAPVLVRGVPARLDRAIANLLDNAAKFSPAGATVTVELRSDGTLTITDHGPGIAAADLAFVFDRFYRAADARRLPGSGLGLAIVKQVADVHQAAVDLRNAPGGGTRATFALPVIPVELSAASARPEVLPAS
ncbi:MAG TPA: HAMP domain-containing sensor histidine kinase [Mycobacteriales bacterium]|jgi:two-component system sensor histidine kinase MprB|nr:HAMP domain-containing sensor histidine kinase [Mycobacteriales bacterium]